MVEDTADALCAEIDPSDGFAISSPIKGSAEKSKND